MIQLTWRQFRLQSMVAAAALAILAAVLAVTGPHLAHLYNTNVAGCTDPNNCAAVEKQFLQHHMLLQTLTANLVLLMPALIGIFWGAPLVAREIETGTFRLAWTQSVTRKRWLAIKLGLVGLASILVAGLISLMVTWWSSPFDKINQSRFSPSVFSERGIAPIGYAAFAFALGVTVGLLLPRVLPAMAITLFVFFGARFGVQTWVRPHFAAPLHIIMPDTQIIPSPSGPTTLGTGAISPGDWVVSDQTIDSSGRVIGQSGFIGSGTMRIGVGPNGVVIGDLTCPNIKVQLTPGTLASPGTNSDAIQQCVTQLGLRESLTYQPAGRYWRFQWSEMGVFLTLAVALAGFCSWLVGRGLT